MKMAFVTGIKFFEYQGGFYATTFSREVIAERYGSVFGDMAVFGSVYPGDAKTPSTMMLASGNGVAFHFQQSARRPIDFWIRQGTLRKEMEEFLATRDGAIIRLPSTLGLMACDLCRKLHKPYLVELVGCPWDSLWNHSWKGKILAPATFLRTRKGVQNATHVVYVSKDFLQRRYPPRGRSTNCSNVALGAFDSSPLQRRRLKIASRTAPSLVVGSCGQIDVAFKGHRFVVEAISRLNRQGYDFSYELVGAGNAEHILEVANRFGVRDRVRVLGQKRRDDVFRWLETIDIYAQPSLTEGMPRGLIEAMSRAVPSVGSIAGGIPELLPPRCLFKKGDAAELAETLQFVGAHQDEIAGNLFDKAKEYDEPLINARRQKFFREFKESIEAGR